MIGAQRLVGRAEELAGLERALARSRTGVSVLELRGEPGIGKTRLLSELAAAAEEEGRLVLGGRASELEHDLPYGIFVDALDDYLRTWDPRRLQRVEEHAGEELGRIFPSLAGAGVQAVALLDERYRAHRAIRAVLEELAAPQPLVLALDDLHWADPASVDLLGTLLRRPPQASVLIALALRPQQLSERLAAVLVDARRSGLVQRLEIGALSEDEAARMLGPGVPAALSRVLHRESGGNPFYLEELSRTPPLPAGIAPSEDDDVLLADAIGVPHAVVAALGAELRSLSVAERRLLEAAAVVGDPFELQLAADAAEITEREALTSLDELLRVDLVRHTELPRRFRFRHPIVRRAVYDGAPSAWRHAAHERAAAALAARGARAALRAYHVEQFAQPGDRASLAVLREAADASAHRAPASAARWYRAALDLLPPDAVGERTELLGQLAGVLAGSGRFAESHVALLELVTLLPEGEPAARVAAIAACAGVEHLLGRHEEAHARLVDALQALPSQHSAEAAALMIDLAMDAFYGRDYDGMHRWGRRAVEVAERVGKPPLAAAAMSLLSLACALSGRIEEGLAARTSASSIVDRLGDQELAARLDALVNLAGAETYLDRYEDADAHFDRGIAVARATGQGQLHPILTQGSGWTLILLGRLGEAADVLERAVEAARLSGNLQALAWTLLNRSFAALNAGDLKLALEAAEESVELGRKLDDSPVPTWSACILGAALVEAGEPARCVETVIPAAGGPDLELIPGDYRVHTQEFVTRAWLALGEHEEAERCAARAEARAAELGLQLGRAMAGRARAAVDLAAGDAAAAAEAALASAAAADGIRLRIEAARSRTLAGRALIAAGDRDAAASELTRAAAELDDCGASRYRDEAERELRRLGRRFKRTPAHPGADGGGLGSLTAREREVAELVRDRKTNREIAAELFLSEKTVETHLRHIFGKLGVSSRASVARAVEAAHGERA